MIDIRTISASRTHPRPCPFPEAEGEEDSRHSERSSFNLSDLRRDIKPFRLYWFPRLRSTNDHAAELRRRRQLFAPAVVLAGRQTAGRGRGQNTWWSGRGCITVTFVLPIDEQIAAHQVPLIAGLAVRNAAAELAGNNAVQLKWPNDLQYKGRKLGGLLCERIMKADLVGLGLNVNLDPAAAPAGLRDAVVSLREIAGRPLPMTDALVCIARQLRLMMARAAEHPFNELLQEYGTHHALVGRNVSVLTSPPDAPLTGRCEGLDDMGRLLLRSHSKLHHVISGHVRVR